MKDYNIRFTGDACVEDVHHISVDYNGNNYNVLFGKYINGGFCCIPNWGIGCELAQFNDTFWNNESLTRALKDEGAAQAISNAIAEYVNALER